jgi:FAD/FMN-containing dehydrogenase
MSRDALLDAVGAITGDGGVITGDALAARPGDWLGRSACGAAAIIRPRSTDELSRIMRLCHAQGQPVVAAGGLTGLVHGADATGNELQISFERMRAVEAVDPVGRTMTVEAGVALEAAQEAALKHDLIYAVDLGSRGSATIGGNISTNAGGNQVVRYGMTRDNILGLEVVLADGTILSSMNRLLKNNAGYDLKQMFIGSEGTLGLVTRAVLRLHPRPLTTSTALLAVDDFNGVTRLLSLCGSRLGPMLTSFEVMWASHYQTVAIDSGRHQPPLPGGHAYYVIVEASGMEAGRDEAFFTALMEETLARGVAVDAVIASSGAQRGAIWSIREDIPAIMQAMMPAAAFDVSLPVTAMDDYVAGLTASVEAEWTGQGKLMVFGHLGDGNLHISLAPRPWSEEAQHRAEELVYGPLAAIGGSVSAEHGIGLEKRIWLPQSRTPEEIATMRLLKAALDPLGLLNPGKVLIPDGGGA